jgi:hypothetical protein
VARLVVVDAVVLDVLNLDDVVRLHGLIKY